MSELQSEAVPDEVRKWLASTFAKAKTPARKAEERPSFKSVATAIRTGLFIEKIYRRMSSSQLMAIPKEINDVLEVSHHDMTKLCICLKQVFREKKNKQTETSDDKPKICKEENTVES